MPSKTNPVTSREILAILLLIVVADVTIYRGCGFAGYALFFLVAPVLLWLGAPRPSFGKSFFLIGLMLVLLAAKTLWCGSVLLVASGFALVVAFAMVLSGLCPYVLETVVFASQTFLAGYEGLMQYRRSAEFGNRLLLRRLIEVAILPRKSKLAQTSRNT